MIGRIVRPVDFERVLAAPQRSRSAHFAVHYLPGAPLPVRPASAVVQPDTPVSAVFPVLSPELSTGGAQVPDVLVDDSARWFGLVVPKRHAKRAVTRTLLKRQLRAAMQRQAAALPEGLWVLRLRAPFDRAEFTSPASELLRETAHREIAELLDRAAHSPLPPRTPRPGGPERGKRGKSVKGAKGAKTGNTGKAAHAGKPDPTDSTGQPSRADQAMHAAHTRHAGSTNQVGEANPANAANPANPPGDSAAP